MDWVKKNVILLVCVVLALAGIGIGAWSLMGFKEVQAKANEIAGIAAQLEGFAASPKDAANEATIKLAQDWYQKANKGTIDAREAAVASNKRVPLRSDAPDPKDRIIVFPKEEKPDSGYLFRIAYRNEMARLPEKLKGGKAPNGNAVEAIVNRMEDKYRKEANLVGTGGELRVPKPPLVQPWTPATPTVRAAGPVYSGGDERGGMGAGQADMRGGMGGGQADMRGGQADMRGGPAMEERPAAITPNRAGGTSSNQPQAAIPTAEQLRPEARKAAVYQAARSVWTYLNDDSFEMHPIGDPASVDKPKIEDLWAAQVLLWVEDDVVQALRRVNEEAIKSQNLPPEDQWVANLPVKHLVSMRISDYLATQAAGADGRSLSIPILHKSSGAGAAGGVRFGQSSLSYTERSRNADFDVVHFALNMVVDARDLPKVLQELCKQNFITPIQVLYRGVDATAATNGGYLYGSGPLLNVDIVCETLFFRSNYDSLMPQMVKDILEGKVADRNLMNR